MISRSSTTERADDPNSDCWTRKLDAKTAPGGVPHVPTAPPVSPLSSSKTKKHYTYTITPSAMTIYNIYCDADVVLSLTPSAVMTTTIV